MFYEQVMRIFVFMNIYPLQHHYIVNTLDEILYWKNINSEKSFLLSELSEPLRMYLKSDLFVANHVFLT